MEPYFIPLGTHKFQVCCWKDCGRDAVTMCTAHTSKDSYALSMCDQHHEEVIGLVPLLENGATPFSLQRKGLLDVEELYYIPDTTEDRKCKYLQWREHKYPKKPKPKVEVPETTEVTPDWKWVSNIGRWMNIQGQIVSLSRLSDKELVCSAILVRRVNFSRITKRVRWVSQLEPPIQFYNYPNAALQVGYEAAGEKLEELKEEILERGL